MNRKIKNTGEYGKARAEYIPIFFHILGILTERRQYQNCALSCRYKKRKGRKNQ